MHRKVDRVTERIELVKFAERVAFSGGKPINATTVATSKE